MKIYMVSWNGASPIGGLERVVYYQMQILKKKHEVELITLDDVYNNKRFSLFKKFRSNPVVNTILTSLYVKSVIKKGDVILTHGYNAAFLEADVLFIHGNWIGYENAIGVSKYSIKRIMGLFECIAGHRAKKMIAVTEYAKQQWIDFYKVNGAKIEVLNNCVDTDVFMVKQGSMDENINILFCGRLGHGKGLEKLLKLSHLIEDRENVYMHIATPTNWNVELFSGLKKTKILVGVKMEDLPTFYNKGDVFFFPSLYEGFEMVTTESLSCGTPVVGNKVGAIRDLNRQGLEGVFLDENETLEALLDMLKVIAVKYKNVDNKMNLHKQMIDTCSIQVYERRLMTICSEVFGD